MGRRIAADGGGWHGEKRWFGCEGMEGSILLFCGKEAHFVTGFATVLFASGRAAGGKLNRFFT